MPFAFGQGSTGTRWTPARHRYEFRDIRISFRNNFYVQMLGESDAADADADAAAVLALSF